MQERKKDESHHSLKAALLLNSCGAINLLCNECFCLYFFLIGEKLEGNFSPASLYMLSWFRIYKIHQHDSRYHNG